MDTLVVASFKFDHSRKRDGYFKFNLTSLECMRPQKCYNDIIMNNLNVR